MNCLHTSAPRYILEENQCYQFLLPFLDEFHQIQINVFIDFLSLSARQILGYYALFCKQQDVLHNG